MLTGLAIDYTIRLKYCVECELVGEKLVGADKEEGQQLYQDGCDVNHTSLCMI